MHHVSTNGRTLCIIGSTHGGLVMPYGGIYLGQHWLSQRFDASLHQATLWTNYVFLKLLPPPPMCQSVDMYLFLKLMHQYTEAVFVNFVTVVSYLNASCGPHLR